MTQRRILVVDDQPHVIRVIRLALERRGYLVDSASDGLQALEKLDASAYDVLITDIDMPKLNGQAMCDEMHARACGPTPLTFVVTGGTDPELRNWAADKAHTRFLEKPLSLKHLTGMLDEHFAAGALQ